MKSLICMPNDDLDRLVSDGGVAYAYDMERVRGKHRHSA